MSAKLMKEAERMSAVRLPGGGSQWGKMGENGERILWGNHFRIGNFPHFSPFIKNFERRSVFFKMA